MKKYLFVTAAIAMTSLNAEAQWGGGRLFKAEGQHTCWSRAAIGYTCNVKGQNFNDCSEAGLRLKNTGCCSNMWLNGQRLADGYSTGFRVVSCSFL